MLVRLDLASESVLLHVVKKLIVRKSIFTVGHISRFEMIMFLIAILIPTVTLII